jgi:hypothetical protein
LTSAILPVSFPVLPIKSVFIFKIYIFEVINGGGIFGDTGIKYPYGANVVSLKLPNLPSDNQIKNFKASEKEYKMFNGGGLYLLVKIDGSKYWRVKFIFAGAPKLTSFGKYP